MKLPCSAIARLLFLTTASLAAHAFAKAPAQNGLTWTPTGATNGNVFYQVAGLLLNGDVLIAGGEDGVPSILTSAQLYDPASGHWSFTGSMSTPRVTHTGTLLADGRFLVTGGQDGTGLVDSAEVYDPVTGQWSLTGSMSTVRSPRVRFAQQRQSPRGRGSRSRTGHYVSHHHRALRSSDRDLDADR